MRHAALLLFGILLLAPAIARAQPAPTVAVTYFDNNTGDAKLEPLRKGLADMLVTDLSVSSELRVVERERLQSLLDELKIQKSPFIDPSTAAKVGKGLSADLLVIGTVAKSGDALRIDARAVLVASGEVAAAVSSSDKIDRVFDIEKAIALALLDKIGAGLSPLGKLKVSKSGTRDVQAFLEYGSALDKIDNKDDAAAAEALKRALARDPEFQAAKVRLETLERRVAALEKRADVLEKSGGYIVDPRTPEDFFANMMTALGRADATRVHVDFMAGWRASAHKGARLPLSRFVEALSFLGPGNTVRVPDDKLAEIDAELRRLARDGATPIERRALYWLALRDDDALDALGKLASKDGFAAWCLGLARAGRHLLELGIPGAMQPLAMPKQGQAAWRTEKVPLPCVPWIGRDDMRFLCQVPAPQELAHVLLAWRDVLSAHRARLAGFARNTQGGASFDVQTLASMRSTLSESLVYLDEIAARVEAHPLRSLTTGKPPSVGEGLAFARKLAAIQAQREAREDAEEPGRPVSFLDPMHCDGERAVGWRGIEQAHGTGRNLAVWHGPKRLCEMVDKAMRAGALTRLVESKGLRAVADPGASAAIVWVVLDVFDHVRTWGGRDAVLLAQDPMMSRRWPTCPEAMAVVAPAIAGADPHGFRARYEAWGGRGGVYQCGKIPSSGDHVELDACGRGDVEACRRLATLYAKSPRLGEGTGGPESFWGRAERAWTKPCDAGDGAYCLELGELYFEHGSPPDQRRGAAIYATRCDDGDPQACRILGERQLRGDGVERAPGQGKQHVRRAITLWQKGCDRGGACIALFAEAQRCGQGNAAACQHLAVDLTDGSRPYRLKQMKDVAERKARARAERCKRGDAEACEAGRHTEQVATSEHDEVADELIDLVAAPLLKRCDAYDAAACKTASDIDAFRAQRRRPDDRPAFVASSGNYAARAQAIWDRSCEAGKPDCPRTIALARPCGKGNAAACARLGRRTDHRRHTPTLPDPNALQRETRDLQERCKRGDTLACTLVPLPDPGVEPQEQAAYAAWVGKVCTLMKPTCEAAPLPANGRVERCDSEYKRLCTKTR